MAVRLIHKFSFSSVNVEDNRIYPNNYMVTLNMITNTDNTLYQNIAFQRVLFFVNELLDSSILINYKNLNLKRLERMAKNSLIIRLPDNPYDQIIGLVLYSKLSAIVEDNLIFENIIIGSGNISYTIEEQDDFGSDECWWNRNDLSVSDDIKHLESIGTWADLDLDWPSNDSDDDDDDDNSGNNNDENNSDKSDNSGNKPQTQTIVVLEGGKKDDSR